QTRAGWCREGRRSSRPSTHQDGLQLPPRAVLECPQQRPERSAGNDEVSLDLLLVDREDRYAPAVQPIGQGLNVPLGEPVHREGAPFGHYAPPPMSSRKCVSVLSSSVASAARRISARRCIRFSIATAAERRSRACSGWSRKSTLSARDLRREAKA